MITETAGPEPTPPSRVPPIRSEAFAEDLEGFLPQGQNAAGPAGRMARTGPSAWLLLPLVVVLIGSASALAWI